MVATCGSSQGERRLIITGVEGREGPRRMGSQRELAVVDSLHGGDLEEVLLVRGQSGDLVGLGGAVGGTGYPSSRPRRCPLRSWTSCRWEALPWPGRRRDGRRAAPPPCRPARWSRKRRRRWSLRRWRICWPSYRNCPFPVFFRYWYFTMLLLLGSAQVSLLLVVAGAVGGEAPRPHGRQYHVGLGNADNLKGVLRAV